MNIYLISLFPELIQHAAGFGVLGRAINQKQITLQCINPRDFTEDRHHTVDDRPYGGGPGMLMKVEPLTKAILAAKAMAEEHGSDRLLKIVYLSPQGRKLNQQMLVAAADVVDDLILIAGRYEGIDERIIQSLVDEEWSIGDYVISGGEFAALIIVDAVSRLLPGVLGDDESAQQDSFMQGLLDCPHYTRPEVIDDMAVPSVLLSGDHQAIRRWRLKQSLGRTWLRRPDLLEAAMNDADLWDEEKTNLLAEFKAEHRP
jgi:tRNA (guanine37-N1)-methyltransferase